MPIFSSLNPFHPSSLSSVRQAYEHPEPAGINAAHQLTKFAEIEQTQQAIDTAWDHSLADQLAQIELSHIQVTTNETVESVVNKMITRMRDLDDGTPGHDHSDAIQLFSTALARMAHLRETFGVTLHMGEKSAAEVASNEEVFHEHKHVMVIFGREVNLMDPDEFVHWLVPFAKPIMEASSASGNIGVFYHKEWLELERSILAHLARTVTNESAGLKTFNIIINALLLVSSLFAVHAGVEQAGSSRKKVQFIDRKIAALRTAIHNWRRTSPHLINTPYIARKKQVLDEQLRLLILEKKQAVSGMVTGYGATVAGFGLFMLAIIDTVADFMRPERTAMKALGLADFTLSSISGIGAAVLGLSTFDQIMRYSKQFKFESLVTRQHLADAGVPGNHSGEAAPLIARHQNYIDLTHRTMKLLQRFLTTGAGMIGMFGFASLLYAMLNTLTAGVYATVSVFKSQDRLNDLQLDSRFLIGKDGAQIGIALLMFIGSTWFLCQHAKLEKLKKSRSEPDPEIASLLLMVGTLVNPRITFDQFSRLAEMLGTCQEIGDELVRHLGVHRKNKKKLKNALQDPGNHAALITALTGILRCKSSYRIHEAALLDELNRTHGHAHLQEEASTEGIDIIAAEKSEQHMTVQRNKVVQRQTAALLDALADAEPDHIDDYFDACIALCSGKVYNPDAADEGHHHHHNPLQLAKSLLTKTGLRSGAHSSHEHTHDLELGTPQHRHNHSHHHSHTHNDTRDARYERLAGFISSFKDKTREKTITLVLTQMMSSGIATIVGPQPNPATERLQQRVLELQTAYTELEHNGLSLLEQDHLDQARQLFEQGIILAQQDNDRHTVLQFEALRQRTAAAA